MKKTVKNSKNFEDRFMRGKSGRILDSIRPDEELEETEEEIQLIEPGSKEEAEAALDAVTTLRAYYIAFVALSVVASVIGLLLVKEKLAYLVGSVAGIAAGIFYIWHLYRSLGFALSAEENAAKNIARRDYMIRACVILGVEILAGALFGVTAALAALICLVALKLSVYLSLFVKELISK